MKSVQQAPKVESKPIEVTITHKPNPAKRAKLEAMLASVRKELAHAAD